MYAREARTRCLCLETGEKVRKLMAGRAPNCSRYFCLLIFVLRRPEDTRLQRYSP